MGTPADTPTRVGAPDDTGVEQLPRGQESVVPRKDRPDGVMDIDRGSSSNPGTKIPAWMKPEVSWDREEQRFSHREMDSMIENTPGYSRAAKDRDRATPRETNAPLGHPKKARSLPGAGDVRVPLSSRQRKDRSKAKFRAQDRMSGTEHASVKTLVKDDPAGWVRLNDALSDAAGDMQDDRISAKDRLLGQRVDRAIQRYEQENDRGHVIYSAALMPDYINAGNIEGYARNNLESEHLRPLHARARSRRPRARPAARCRLRDRDPPRALPRSLRQPGRHPAPPAARDGLGGPRISHRHLQST